ncbi:dihydrodipicolinate synthase family protein [Micromonospora craniellae]|nr:dihydrodipicolinate synthase family protein [Micromonospora craniellae]QOC92293.1 dihydrodipicolinate synthase family protein [Micromonospora craniellae]
MITPMCPDETVDEDSARRLTRVLLSAGVDGLWLLGTSGEFAALDAGARASLVEAVCDEVAGRVPVVVNVSQPGTALTIRTGRDAVRAGADGVAATPPFYHPHSPAEIDRHYRTTKDALGDVPLFAYHIPQNVQPPLDAASIVALAADGVLQGMKDSQPNLQWFRLVADRTREATGPDPFTMLMGTRTLVDVAADVGAHGVVPAMANLVPAACRRAFFGESGTVREDVKTISGCEALTAHVRATSGTATAICAIKAVLCHWGVIASDRVGLPLVAPAADQLEALGTALAALTPLTDPEGSA